MPSGLSVLRREAAGRPDHEALRQGERHVVDAEVREELRPGVERVAVPLPVREDADLREPLHDEVVVVHPARAPDAAVREERVPLDAEARGRAGGDRPRRPHLHDRAVVGVAVLVHVPQGRGEVLLRLAEEADGPHLDPAESALLPLAVVRGAPALAPRGRREVVAEGVPVEVEGERGELPFARVAPLEDQGAGERPPLGVEPGLDACSWRCEARPRAAAAEGRRPFPRRAATAAARDRVRRRGRPGRRARPLPPQRAAGRRISFAWWQALGTPRRLARGRRRFYMERRPAPSLTSGCRDLPDRALAGAHVAAAALRPRAAARAAGTAAATAAERPAEAAAAAAPEGALRPLGRRLVDAQVAPAERRAVELLDGRRRRLVGRERDEGEAAGPAAHAVGRDHDLRDLSRLGEQLLQLLPRRVEAHVTDEDLRAHRSPSLLEFCFEALGWRAQGRWDRCPHPLPSEGRKPPESRAHRESEPWPIPAPSPPPARATATAPARMRVEVEDGRLRRDRAAPGEPRHARGRLPQGAALRRAGRTRPTGSLAPAAPRAPPARSSASPGTRRSTRSRPASRRVRDEHGPQSVLYYTGSGTKGLLNGVGLRVLAALRRLHDDLRRPLLAGRARGHAAHARRQRAQRAVGPRQRPAHRLLGQERRRDQRPPDAPSSTQALERGARLVVDRPAPHRDRRARRAARPAAARHRRRARARAWRTCSSRDGLVDRPFVDAPRARLRGLRASASREWPPARAADDHRRAGGADRAARRARRHRAARPRSAPASACSATPTAARRCGR